MRHGDLLFLHGLQQRRLRLRRGAIDFIGQQQIGENRAGLKPQRFSAVAVFLHHGRADHVGRHQVRRELDARIFQRHGLRQRAHQHGFPKARRALQQHVPAGQQGDQHALDHFRLAHDGLGNFAADLRHFFGEKFRLLAQRLAARLAFCSHRTGHEPILVLARSLGQFRETGKARSPGPACEGSAILTQCWPLSACSK